MHSLSKNENIPIGESTVAAQQKKLLSTLPGSLFKCFHIRRLQKHLFSHTNPYILNVTQQCWWSYFELGLPVLKREPMRFKLNITFLDFIFFCLGDVQICRHFGTSFVFFFSPICRIYSINRPGHFLNVWTLRVGAYSRLGAQIKFLPLSAIVVCLLYKHQWNTKWAFARKLDIFTCENNMLSLHVKISPLLWLRNISRLSHQKTIKVKWFGISLVFISRVEKIFLHSLVKYFSTIEEKRPCNILYLLCNKARNGNNKTQRFNKVRFL